ncbi:hypothetical protein [Streptomyces sp. NBC_01538]|uniref:hypothetical protein n=1 Tax=Streptomyces sp. NBC_01538 TaxID=2903897 RepID=UPI0038708D2A
MTGRSRAGRRCSVGRAANEVPDLWLLTAHHIQAPYLLAAVHRIPETTRGAWQAPDGRRWLR